MSVILIRNAKVVDPKSPYHHQHIDIFIKNGSIRIIAPAYSLPVTTNTQLIEYEGLHVSPGWVDIGVHLCDPGSEWKENIYDLNMAAARGGFTHILCYPNTHPPIDNSQYIQSLKSRTQHLAVSFLLSGCISHHAAGKELAEMFDMKQAGAIAFSDGVQNIQSSGLMLRAMQYLQAFDGLLITYPTDKELTEYGQMNEGPVANYLGIPGIPEIAELIGINRTLTLHSYNPIRLLLQPISSPQALAALTQANDSSIAVGIASYHIALEDSIIESFNSNYKVNPPLRNAEQAEALRVAIQQKQVDILISGHHAQGIEEKKTSFAQAEEGMLNLQTSFALAHENLVEKGYISLSDLIRLMSIRPREILGLSIPSVNEGEEADLTLFNPNQEWTLTKEMVQSRAKNSPFFQQKRKGKPLGIVRGKQSITCL